MTPSALVHNNNNVKLDKCYILRAMEDLNLNPGSDNIYAYTSCIGILMIRSNNE